MKSKLLSLSFSLAFALAVNAQQTYSSGPITTGTTTKSGVAAPTIPAQHQWSELQNAAGNTTQTNNYHGFDGYYNNSNVNLRVFDDFTVPFSQTWNMSSVDVYCYQLDYLGSTPPVNELKVRIWSGFPYLNTSTIVAGNMTANILDAANSQDMYILRISNTLVPTPGTPPTENRRVWRLRANLSATLTAGVYWIEYSGKSVNNAIFKFIPTTTVDSRGSGNAAQYNAIADTFSSLLDTGSPLSAPDVQQTLAFNINYSNPLSTDEVSLESRVRVYPNPVSQIFNVEVAGSEAVKYELTNVMGKVVKRGETGANIDVSELASGVYLLGVTVDGQKVYKKIVKK
ncbi:T9SS type A sorting domain-containing protein [Flavobacterium sp.]|uniref:T9SS type A sorting domain-containing protein n=1 Tax=Flavobacterium sp. TaxID=239 RepID=UPI00120FDB78|nr:T9SS type A sorting domain-containing protein [Flavobacterium sp.]RZJ69232.1 MAG: T9SS type A sorting domain-containing protein [Flavobacterium sp.]